MSDFETYDLTIPAGEQRDLLGGGYFRVHEADGVLLVTFKSDTGHNLASGHFEEGEWARFPFGQVAVKNDTATAITCKLRVSKFESGSDQMTGALTVAGEILLPVPVAKGIHSNQLGSSLGQHAMGAGNQSSVVFVPGADSYSIGKVEIVSDVPIAFGLGATTEAAVIAEAIWSNTFGLGTLPFGAPAGITPYHVFNIAAGASAISDAAAGYVYFGTLPAGRHVIEMDPVAYIPAGHAAAMSWTFKNVSAVAGNLAVLVSGLKV